MTGRLTCAPSYVKGYNHGQLGGRAICVKCLFACQFVVENMITRLWNLSHNMQQQCFLMSLTHRCCRCRPRRRHCPPQADHLSQRRLSHLYGHLAGCTGEWIPLQHHPKCSQPAGLQRGPPVLGGGGGWEDLLGAGAHLPKPTAQGPRGGLLAGPGQRVLVCGIL